MEFAVKNMKMKHLRKSYGFNVINICHGSMETVGVNPSRVPEIFLISSLLIEKFKYSINFFLMTSYNNAFAMSLLSCPHVYVIL